ncbi:hypothetical protein Godav_024392 [Gossypium davidsonii]|uniref:Dof zinc finger protein n=2 Tax=Gossypium TaxID=3633 RepID=A0A7J8TB35_GOSDV|nr:hypothetical protein [Gossypium davidsonii]MBA0663415.1 hypothetical protein [Gossypium klotzschianum]
MGLSSKQVSSDGGHGWSQSLLQAQTLPKASIMKKRHTQNQHQQPLKCPRCDSLNTKFCYYNNYNKSQPRHFCKACKRHWTKGGTLRNVPVGGGRKNQRLKPGIKAASTAIKTSTASSDNSNRLLLDSLMAIQWQPQHPFPPLLDCNNMLMDSSSSLLLPQTQGLEFPFSSSSSSSISPSIYNYTGEANSSRSQTWQVPCASMDMANYWNLDDIDELVSTDLNNIPWVDSEIKP